MNYLKYFKYILLVPLVIGVAFFSFSLLSSLLNEPEILIVQKLNIQNEINKNKTQETNQNITNEPQLITNNFNYKLVGYRAGQNDSSIILKKGSNEFLVKIGEDIDSYTLESVSTDEVVFSLQGNLYKIENKVGKNK
jgi:type II secretory pathway component PulC